MILFYMVCVIMPVEKYTYPFASYTLFISVLVVKVLCAWRLARIYGLEHRNKTFTQINA